MLSCEEEAKFWKAIWKYQLCSFQGIKIYWRLSGIRSLIQNRQQNRAT